LAIDIDVDKDGESSLKAIEVQHGTLPASVEQITGGGGRHIFYRYAKHRDIRNSASKLGKGIDIRANGGYAILPPSPHESGRTYQWSVDSAATFADAPEWLLDLLDKKVVATPIADAVEGCTWADVIELGIDEGGRDDGLARLVGHYLPHHDPREVLQLALLFNAHRCRPPLPDADVLRICNSIAAAELRKGIAL
jgi:hypothetical protein